MPTYSKENTPLPNVKPFKKQLTNRQYRALKRLLKVFHPTTARPFYTGEKDKDTPLVSPEEAKDRSFTLAMLIIITKLLVVAYYRQDISRSQRRFLIRVLRKCVMPISCRASDCELRLIFANYFIEHIYALKKSYVKNTDTHFHLVTLSCDSWCSSILEPEVDLHRAKTVVTRLLREYGFCNAIGVFEIQPILNHSHNGDGAPTLMLHCHVIVWREKWTKRQFKAFREKCEARLSNSLLESPVHRRKIGLTKNDILRVASYLPKLPGTGKMLSADKSLIESETPLSSKRILRHMEVLSSIPLKSMMFAVGEEANTVKSNIWKDTKTWSDDRKRRVKPHTMSGDEMRRQWSAVWNIIEPKYTTAPVVRLSRGE